MFKRNKEKNKKGFSLVELVVVIGIMAVLLAILTPSLLMYTEKSRAQRDDSAMDEVVEAVQLAMSDQKCYDEMLRYSCTNNYLTYTDSSGSYGQKINDAEFWAPDGSGRATTITFNPIPGSGFGGNAYYALDSAIINDMTYDNGSSGEPRTMEGALIDNNQCYLKNASLNDNGNPTGYLYNRIRQIVGDNVMVASATYQNSSYTIFIKFNQKDGVTVADVNGSFNGTNLYENAPSSVGSGTNKYDDIGEPITRPDNKGGLNSTPTFNQSDLTGSGSFGGSLDYKPCEHQETEVRDVSDTYTGDTVCKSCGKILSSGQTIRVKIPEGGKYTAADGTVYNPGEEMPETATTGDTYKYGDYEYKYNQYCTYNNSFSSKWDTDESQGGWGVRCTNNLSSAPGDILESINGKPITNMNKTFSGFDNIKVAPKIPASVVDMNSTFDYCDSLQSAPDLSQCTKLTNMFSAFRGCGALEVVPTIPNSVMNIESLFNGCGSIKTYMGSKDPDGDFSNYILPQKITSMETTFTSCNKMTKAPSVPNSVENMRCTFEHCKKLISAPKIPDSVTNMEYTFNKCTSLTTAPTIPSRVSEMRETFANCTSLTGIIIINANPTSYHACFSLVDFEQQSITLDGDSNILDKLSSGGRNYCKTCNGKCNDSH